MNIVELDQALKQIAPVLGVSLGKLEDNTTWEINFSKSANETQKQQANDFLKTLNKIDELPKTSLEDRFLALETRIAALERKP